MLATIHTNGEYRGLPSGIRVVEVVREGRRWVWVLPVGRRRTKCIRVPAKAWAGIRKGETWHDPTR